MAPRGVGQERRPRDVPEFLHRLGYRNPMVHRGPGSRGTDRNDDMIEESEASSLIDPHSPGYPLRYPSRVCKQLPISEIISARVPFRLSFPAIAKRSYADLGGGPWLAIKQLSADNGLSIITIISPTVRDSTELLDWDPSIRDCLESALHLLFPQYSQIEELSPNTHVR